VNRRGVFKAAQVLGLRPGIRLALASAVVAFASVGAVLGQEAGASAPAAGQEHPIRVRAGEVTAPVVIRDRHTGEMILDLSEKDFRIFDNGTPQSINHFDIGGELLSVALLIETSSQIEPILPEIQRAGVVFTDSVMGQTGEAAVLGYDDTVNVLEPFTADAEPVQNTIRHLSPGTAGCRLFDGMQRAISLLKEQPAIRRRVLLIIAEARDSNSGAKFEDVVRMAELNNVTIYSVWLSSTLADVRQPAEQYQPPQIGPTGVYPVPRVQLRPTTPEADQEAQPNMNLGAALAWLAKTATNMIGKNSLGLASDATGGLMVSTMSGRSIERGIDEVGGELHASYTIGYRPPADVLTGYHAIKVVVHRRGVRVRTRPGYYLEPPG
jgi:VWFA-related protein